MHLDESIPVTISFPVAVLLMIFLIMIVVSYLPGPAAANTAGLLQWVLVVVLALIVLALLTGRIK